MNERVTQSDAKIAAFQASFEEQLVEMQREAREEMQRHLRQVQVLEDELGVLRQREQAMPASVLLAEADSRDAAVLRQLSTLQDNLARVAGSLDAPKSQLQNRDDGDDDDDGGRNADGDGDAAAAAAVTQLQDDVANAQAVLQEHLAQHARELHGLVADKAQLLAQLDIYKRLAGQLEQNLAVTSAASAATAAAVARGSSDSLSSFIRDEASVNMSTLLSPSKRLDASISMLNSSSVSRRSASAGAAAANVPAVHELLALNSSLRTDAEEARAALHALEGAVSEAFK